MGGTPADGSRQACPDFDVIFATNARGLFLCLRSEVEAMRDGRGSIVNVGSVAGQCALRGGSLYNASKSAVTLLTKSAAAEFARWGVRINEVSPGPVLTPMLTGFLESTEHTSAPMAADEVGAFYWTVPAPDIVNPGRVEHGSASV
ncbi:SDR family oxidoreductase [Synechococcus sp. CBW1002]|uniref:SDR family NAD(P)-dependent oxidoreductase n=1 Tax=Synechococcus sp. CBW1002 TaxID=1353134 RepID=UPI0018CE92E4|nr:SDR family oxidoreductase [Synechococcus sp. CBW1002]